MQKKRKAILKGEKPVWRRRAAVAAVVLAVIVVLGFVIVRSLLQAPEIKFSLKAAIVDQLGGEVPNPDFGDTGVVANMLRSTGFDVTYYSNETVNVAFYRGLAKYNYGLIILRSHAALREDGSTVDIFTNERYDGNKYVSDQNNGLLTKGSYSWRPEEYFAISPKFVENLEGTFPKSVVIAMGCHTMNNTIEEMAEAFAGKGVKIYVGWSGLVGYSQTDNNTVELMKRLLIQNKTLALATQGLNDPTQGSVMNYYPPDAGGMGISYLISEAKSSLVAHVFAENSEPQLMRAANQCFQIPVRPNCVVKRFSRLETVAYS